MRTCEVCIQLHGRKRRFGVIQIRYIIIITRIARVIRNMRSAESSEKNYHENVPNITVTNNKRGLSGIQGGWM